MTRAVLSVPLAKIGELPANQYVGLIDEAGLACLSLRMAAEGQQTPIWLRRNGNAAKLRWSVIAGRHRVLVARSLGWTHIDAEERADAGMAVDRLRALQVAENLDRRVLRPIERAIFIAERARQEEAIDHPGHVGEARADRANRVRHSPADMLIPPSQELTPPSATMALGESADDGWRERAALSAGCSIRSLARYQAVHVGVVQALPDLFAALNAHPLGESLGEMIALAKVGKADPIERKAGREPYRLRRLVAEAIVADPAMPSVHEAVAQVTNAPSKGARPAPGEVDAVAHRHWTRMPFLSRRAFIDAIADDMDPRIAAGMIGRLNDRARRAASLSVAETACPEVAAELVATLRARGVIA